MKKIITAFALLFLLSCENDSQKTDTEKAESETKIEIKTDSAEVKIGKNGVSIKGDGKDSVNIQINADDGIKVEGKDGKIEIKTDDGGKLKVEKKGKEVNIQIKEN